MGTKLITVTRADAVIAGGSVDEQRDHPRGGRRRRHRANAVGQTRPRALPKMATRWRRTWPTRGPRHPPEGLEIRNITIASGRVFAGEESRAAAAWRSTDRRCRNLFLGSDPSA